MARRGQTGSGPNFGIGEWYGYLLTGLSPAERTLLYEAYSSRRKMPCPFKPSVDGLKQPCHKAGGVCSFRQYEMGSLGEGVPSGGEVGKLRVACPSRFLGCDLESRVAEELIGCKEPVVIREVGFLSSEVATQDVANEEIDLEVDEGLDEEAERSGADVGRIDQILLDLRTGQWCALEHQAVYFSGRKMPPELELLANHAGPGIPMPAGKRRPDYRSSGPKRLMPQLQIKVPSLRRWGKKMAVIVDESFFAALAPMDVVPHPSNADIAWFIVELVPTRRSADMRLKDVRFTTLERAVEGLTAGKPVSKPEFERRMRQKLSNQSKKRKDLVRKLMKAKIDPGL